MKNINLNIEIPKELAEMMIENAAISPIDKNAGYLIMSKNLHRFSKNIEVNAYLMALKGKTYFPVKEIGSFSFFQYDHAREFIDRLPDMTAIDMLLLQSHCHSAAKS